MRGMRIIPCCVIEGTRVGLGNGIIATSFGMRGVTKGRVSHIFFVLKAARCVGSNRRGISHFSSTSNTGVTRVGMANTHCRFAPESCASGGVFRATLGENALFNHVYV